VGLIEDIYKERCTPLVSSGNPWEPVKDGVAGKVDEEKEFDELLKLYHDIKAFKVNSSYLILNNFHSAKYAKFKTTKEEREPEDLTRLRRNLSTSAVCTFALSEYFKIWDDNKKNKSHETRFKVLKGDCPDNKADKKYKVFELFDYYKYIIDTLQKSLEPMHPRLSPDGGMSTECSDDLESLDEFTVLNTLSMMMGIRLEILRDIKRNSSNALIKNEQKLGNLLHELSHHQEDSATADENEKKLLGQSRLYNRDIVISAMIGILSPPFDEDQIKDAINDYIKLKENIGAFDQGDHTVDLFNKSGQLFETIQNLLKCKKTTISDIKKYLQDIEEEVNTIESPDMLDRYGQIKKAIELEGLMSDIGNKKLRAVGQKTKSERARHLIDKINMQGHDRDTEGFIKKLRKDAYGLKDSNVTKMVSVLANVLKRLDKSYAEIDIIRTGFEKRQNINDEELSRLSKELQSGLKESRHKDMLRILNTYQYNKLNQLIISLLKRSHRSDLYFNIGTELDRIDVHYKKIAGLVNGSTPKDETDAIAEIGMTIDKLKMIFKYDMVIIRIINLLKIEYSPKKAFNEKRHPFIYFVYLKIIKLWSPEDLDEISRDIYKNGKYEMYRQMALYKAKDRTLFDVKRLIYSFLIVSMQNRYSNNLMKEEVLKVIFDEQFPTGLWPIGQIVKPDFVIENGKIYHRSRRIISASPLLLSVECMNDMLMCDELQRDIERYHYKLKLTHDWLIKRLRIDGSTGNPLGWYPEYEGSLTSKAWVAGHCLIFMKKYCDLVSSIIETNAIKYLDARMPDELESAMEWDDLADSYRNRPYLSKMFKMEHGKYVSNSDYGSALIYGPPGSGKSTVAMSLAKRLGWKYVEIPPGKFLDRGEENIIPNINAIFKRLLRMKDTVIFFDEVDQLVERRKDSTSTSSRWIVTSLLPELQALRNNKKVKFILATNDITKVDTAITRRGRIDFVLPMGAICWRDRLKMLRRGIRKTDNKSDEYKKIFEGLFEPATLRLLSDAEIDAKQMEDILSAYLRRYLRRTDFVQIKDLLDIVRIFGTGEDLCDNIKGSPLFKAFFLKGDNEDIDKYENDGYRNFHDEEQLRFMQLPPLFKLDEKDIKDILRENTYCPAIFRISDLNNPREIAKEIGYDDGFIKIREVFPQKVVEMLRAHKKENDDQLTDYEKILLVYGLNHYLRTFSNGSGADGDMVSENRRAIESTDLKKYINCRANELR
jgi:SpoVK/Ycf46/Vps4 family AAA+-type ATPase